MLGTPVPAPGYVGWEQVVEAAPDVLVLMPCGNGLDHTVAEAEKLRELPGWTPSPPCVTSRSTPWTARATSTGRARD